MMNSDDVPRSMPFQQGRKPLPLNTRSSPSPSYNYNYNTNSGFSSQQHMRRKIGGGFKRDNGNGNDRIMRQNDLIIRLLKEIRDRLPPPPVVAAPVISGGVAETARQNGPVEEMERADAPRTESPVPVQVAVNPGTTANSIGEPLQTEQQPLREGSSDGE